MVSALGNSEDWLELVLSNMETLPDPLSQRPPLHRPLVTLTKYNIFKGYKKNQKKLKVLTNSISIRIFAK